MVTIASISIATVTIAISTVSISTVIASVVAIASIVTVSMVSPAVVFPLVGDFLLFIVSIPVAVSTIAIAITVPPLIADGLPAIAVVISISVPITIPPLIFNLLPGIASIIVTISSIFPLVADAFLFVVSTIAGFRSSIASVVAGVVGSIAMINQVYTTEVIVAIRLAIGEGIIRSIARSWGTRLHIAVAIGAEHERFVIPKVESIILAVILIFAMVGVGLGGVGLLAIAVLTRGSSQAGE